MAMYGFTVQNRKAELAGFPKEDSFAYDKKRKVACVADGITRDFLDGSVVTRDLKGLIRVLTGKYPKYAQKASQICVKNFLETKSLEESNKAIGNYNSSTFKEIDYLARDFAGCTAAGFWEEDEFLHWQFICDSGIAVVDSKGILRFRTSDEGPHSKEKNPHLEMILKQHGGFNNQKGRRIIRSQYRNNPEEEFAYGALTGEETAIPYIRKGIYSPTYTPFYTYPAPKSERLREGDYVLAFTDGIADIIFNKNPRVVSRCELAPRLNIDGVPVPPNEPLIIPPLNEDFFHYLSQGGLSELKKFCKERVRSEGTLIVYKNISYPPRGAWGRDLDYETHIND